MRERRIEIFAPRLVERYWSRRLAHPPCSCLDSVVDVYSFIFITSSFPRVLQQCYGSRLDPVLIRSVDLDPDPDLESGSGSRRAKMTHKNRKKLENFTF
jgi:hypothetical protein